MCDRVRVSRFDSYSLFTFLQRFFLFAVNVNVLAKTSLAGVRFVSWRNEQKYIKHGETIRCPISHLLASISRSQLPLSKRGGARIAKVPRSQQRAHRAEEGASQRVLSECVCVCLVRRTQVYSTPHLRGVRAHKPQHTNNNIQYTKTAAATAACLERRSFEDTHAVCGRVCLCVVLVSLGCLRRGQSAARAAQQQYHSPTTTAAAAAAGRAHEARTRDDNPKPK